MANLQFIADLMALHEAIEDLNDHQDEFDINVDECDQFADFLTNHVIGESALLEAKYRGNTVKLNKPTAGDVKKFKVYVRNPETGKIIKVNFGQKGMRIRKSNPEARRSYRARMHCDNPGPKTKANYWSCKKW